MTGADADLGPQVMNEAETLEWRYDRTKGLVQVSDTSTQAPDPTSITTPTPQEPRP